MTAPRAHTIVARTIEECLAAGLGTRSIFEQSEYLADQVLADLTKVYLLTRRPDVDTPPEWAVLRAYRESGPDDTMTSVKLKAVQLAQEAQG